MPHPAYLLQVGRYSEMQSEQSPSDQPTTGRKLAKAAGVLASWMLPVLTLLVIFGAVAFLTQGHHSIVQRLYTRF